MSESPADHLPRSMKWGDVSRVCKVIARFSPRDFEANAFKHKKKFFRPKKDHWEAEFDLAVTVGSTTLSFEILSKDGKKYTQTDATVDVQWEEAEVKQTAASKRTIYAPKRK